MQGGEKCLSMGERRPLELEGAESASVGNCRGLDSRYQGDTDHPSLQLSEQRELNDCK